MGQELTEAGLQVLALERGSWRDTPTDFAPTFIQDELRYRYRGHLFEQPARDTLTFRNNPDEVALPMRRLGSFLPGAGVGGSTIHWNGQTWRFLPYDFQIRTETLQRYGKKMVPDDMPIQDWGVTYDELEPFYAEFEELTGIAGQAGNLKGQTQPGGNPFEGPRSTPYPTPPMKQTYGPILFAEAAKAEGMHPFPCPSANMSSSLHQSAGRPARTLHLLRFLREVRLRQLLEGQRPDDHSAGADEERQLHFAHRMQRDEDQPR